jgi:DNA mismatch endonuclease (patch repair protein)
VPGRPDICFVSKKHGLLYMDVFWHRCPHCNYSSPKQIWRLFGLEKFGKNVARDQKKVHELQELGWKTFVVWECEIKKDVEKIAKEIQLLATGFDES